MSSSNYYLHNPKNIDCCLPNVPGTEEIQTKTTLFIPEQDIKIKYVWELQECVYSLKGKKFRLITEYSRLSYVHIH